MQHLHGLHHLMGRFGDQIVGIVRAMYDYLECEITDRIGKARLPSLMAKINLLQSYPCELLVNLVTDVGPCLVWART